MSLTPYPTLRLKLTMPQALKLQFLPAVPGSNAAASAAAAQAAADAAQSAANTATAATANKVDKSGDTMTGFLTLNANPNTNLQAATKQYVDGLVAGGPFQPLDADLSSIAGATVTNQWLYRSAANTWAPVTLGATLSFSAGVLNTTAGGGNVIASGTPTNGQWAQWTGPATIQGVDAANTPFQPLDADLTSLAAASATNAIYYRSAADTWATVTIGANLTFTGGTLAATGGAAAPIGAEYITSTADATLTAERVLTDTATITWDRTTPGQIKASTAAGGGNVSNSGTPSAGQYAKWVTATTIQGVVVGTVLTDIGAQPLDADLTSLAAAAGTNTIYYRSAANTWSPVVVSTGLAFSGGNLTATASGAPVGAEYITSTTDATLTAERVLTDTATVTWDRTTAGQIKANAIGGTSTTGAPQGRLTIATIPVMTSTVAGMTSIQYVPYVGDKVPIYDGTNWTMTAIPGGLISCATTDTAKNPAAIGASKVNDWFVWNDAGTIRLGHGPDWTNDTTPSGTGTRPGLVTVNGIWLNNAAITNGPAASRGTYVGTTRSNASSQLDWIFGGIAAGGTAGFFGVWNTYNRVDVATMVRDNTDTWTYAVAAWQAANNSPNMRVSFIVGLIEDSISAAYFGLASHSAGGPAAVGVGLNSTTAFSGTTSYSIAASVSAVLASYAGLPALGFNFVSAIEYASSPTATYAGDIGFVYVQSGLSTALRM